MKLSVIPKKTHKKMPSATDWLITLTYDLIYFFIPSFICIFWFLNLSIAIFFIKLKIKNQNLSLLMKFLIVSTIFKPYGLFSKKVKWIFEIKVSFFFLMSLCILILCQMLFDKNYFFWLFYSYVFSSFLSKNNL